MCAAQYKISIGGCRECFFREYGILHGVAISIKRLFCKITMAGLEDSKITVSFEYNSLFNISTYEVISCLLFKKIKVFYVHFLYKYDAEKRN